MIEDELQLPTPRPIRRRAGHGWFIGCANVFILPHTIIGIVALAGVVWMTLLALAVTVAGAVVPGQVTDRTSSRGKSGTTYRVTYTYRLGEMVHTGGAVVPEAAYQHLPKGAAVEVRVLPVLPEATAYLEGVGATSRWADLGGFWFFALFWNGVTSVFVWMLFIWPWLLRGVVRWGVPTKGRVTGKDERRGKSTSYHVSYTYQVPQIVDGLETGTLEERTGTMQVRFEDYKMAQEGDRVTVLYHPRRPGRSLIYRYAAYEVVAE